MIGCRGHLIDVISDNNLSCPKCKEKVALTRIRSLPALNRSIETFAEQSKALEKLTAVPVRDTPIQASEEKEEKEKREEPTSDCDREE